jgi:hypothetical protein
MMLHGLLLGSPEDVIQCHNTASNLIIGLVHVKHGHTRQFHTTGSATVSHGAQLYLHLAHTTPTRPLPRTCYTVLLHHPHINTSPMQQMKQAAACTACPGMPTSISARMATHSTSKAICQSPQQNVTQHPSKMSQLPARMRGMGQPPPYSQKQQLRTKNSATSKHYVTGRSPSSTVAPTNAGVFFSCRRSTKTRVS